VAVVSTAALICDTGALLDYIVKGARDHQRFRLAIDRARTRYVPGLVLAEVDYFLRGERPAMNALMHDLARGAFTYAPPALDQTSRRAAPQLQVPPVARPRFEPAAATQLGCDDRCDVTR
jgi:predicted nucleic acid-binding protein